VKCQNRDPLRWHTHICTVSHTYILTEFACRNFDTSSEPCAWIQSFQPYTKITPARTMMSIDTCIERDQKHTRCLLQNTIHDWMTGTRRWVGTRRQYWGCKRWELNEPLFAKIYVCVWEELLLSLGQASYLFSLFLPSEHTHAGSCSQCYLDRCNNLLSNLI